MVVAVKLGIAAAFVARICYICFTLIFHLFLQYHALFFTYPGIFRAARLPDA